MIYTEANTVDKVTKENMLTTHKLVEESINSLMEIINDESPKSFKFTKDEFIYKEYSMTSEEITEARKYGYSFGSFSFDEPREDLKKLKLL